MVFTGQPFEECLHGHHTRPLGAERQRVAVLLAVIKQISLIPLQHGPGDFPGLGNAAHLGPERKAGDTLAAVFDGVGGIIMHRQIIQEPCDLVFFLYQSFLVKSLS